MAILVFPPSHDVPYYEHLVEIAAVSFVIWWFVYYITAAILAKDKSNETY
jgi:hypothetical protein